MRVIKVIAGVVFFILVIVAVIYIVTNGEDILAVLHFEEIKNFFIYLWEMIKTFFMGLRQKLL